MYYGPELERPLPHENDEGDGGVNQFGKINSGEMHAKALNVSKHFLL